MVTHQKRFGNKPVDYYSDSMHDFNEIIAVQSCYYSHCSYSHSIVAGGLLVISYTMRLTPSTSLTMRLEIVSSTL